MEIDPLNYYFRFLVLTIPLQARKLCELMEMHGMDTTTYRLSIDS
jgi:hypothetical protein